MSILATGPRTQPEEPQTEESQETAAKHTMQILDSRGVTTIAWTPGNKVEEQAAETEFQRMVGEGKLAYKTDKGGENAEQIRTFDPEAASIEFVSPMFGG